MAGPRFTKRITRDSFLFGFGVVGVVYQTVVENADRPTLLILFAACMGLPVFLNVDERTTKAQTPPPAAPPAAKVEEERSEGP